MKARDALCRVAEAALQAFMVGIFVLPPIGGLVYYVAPDFRPTLADWFPLVFFAPLALAVLLLLMILLLDRIIWR